MEKIRLRLAEEVGNATYTQHRYFVCDSDGLAVRHFLCGCGCDGNLEEGKVILHDAVTVLLAAPDPAPKEINTDGIVTFVATKIVPILLAFIAVGFIAKASRGGISQVLTSSAIVIIGLIFLGGATTLWLAGPYFANLLFK